MPLLQQRSRLRDVLLSTVLLMTIIPGAVRPAASANPSAFVGKLDNGLEVVVIPDHRAPVVSHMVWYRVGAADERPGKSGIAHFLEHLMFKGTEKVAAGQFSKIVARNGGQDNAFTGQDVTSYFQNVAKDRLPLVMEMEADRMANLRLAESDVLTERNVILEERRSRTDNNPSALLDEQMKAMLYLNHPYGKPVIGWAHEMAGLDREDALDWYKRYYAPNNAILVVAGDVEPEEVMILARKTYGLVPAGEAVLRSPRPAEPPPIAPRRIELADPRAGQPTLERDYLVPSYTTAGPREAEALDLLVKILASGSTSRIYRSLVVDRKLAASAGGYYIGSGLDSSQVSLYAVAADGHGLAEVEQALDAVIADIAANGVTEAELKRARTGFIADYVYEADSKGQLARRYGWALATGETIEMIESWPERLKQVTTADIKAAAQKFLDARRSVTGWLVPAADAGPAASTGKS